jgi:hypothetical protein
MKLGDTIYVYEQYGRRESSLEDHLSKWKEFKIVDQTKISWVARFGIYSHSEVKIDKKTMQSRSKERIATSREEIAKKWEDDRWTSLHAYSMGDKLRFVKDADVLRKVAELIGYDPK